MGKDSPLTLATLIDGLRTEQSGIDILYLVCHGALLPKGAHLWLQNDKGEVKVTRGDELAVRLSELTKPPRLVVLAACESAGSENAATSDKVKAGELVTLTPLLAESGVPAVLAMQGKISMETVRQAMPIFFAELLKDGQIDRALAVARGSQSNMFARDKVKEKLRKQIVRKHGDALPDDLKTASLSKLFRAVGKLRHEDPADPYTLLAQLPARVIITANPDNLLQEALKTAEKEPEVFFFNWREKTDEGERYDEEPTVDKPLIYHILGYFRDDDSLVLTEDDYFDYLIGMTQYKPRIPKVIPYATANTSLLFLGFQLTDWSFRVLFRLIMNQEGGARRKEFAHVAVQVDPEDHTLIDPQIWPANIFRSTLVSRTLRSFGAALASSCKNSKNGSAV